MATQGEAEKRGQDVRESSSALTRSLFHSLPHSVVPRLPVCGGGWLTAFVFCPLASSQAPSWPRLSVLTEEAVELRGDGPFPSPSIPIPLSLRPPTPSPLPPPPLLPPGPATAAVFCEGALLPLLLPL